MKQIFFILFILGNLVAIKSYPQSDFQIDSAFSYYQKFQFQKAIEYLTEKDSLNSEMRLLLASCHLKLGELTLAKESTLKAYKNDSTNQLVIQKLASIYKDEAEYDKAISLYNKLIISDTSNSYYLRELAKIHLLDNDLIKAIVVYNGVLDLNPNDLESRIKLAETYIKIRQFDLANKLIIDHVYQKPYNKRLLYLSLKINYQQKKYTEVVSIADTLFSIKDTSLLSLKLSGISNYHLKNYQSSIRCLIPYLISDKSSEIVCYYLGLNYNQLGHKDSATYYLEKAIDLGVSENIGIYYTQLAINFEEDEDYPKAINAYKVAYKATKNKILLYHLARNYDIFYKDKGVALRYYEQYLSENDTANERYQDYSKYRVQELKEAVHFEIESKD